MNLKQKVKQKSRLILESILFDSKQCDVPASSEIVNSSLIGNVNIGQRVSISKCELNGNITIGNNTSINGPNTDIHSKINSVKIGNFCSIARNVSIQEYNHRFNNVTSYFIKHHIFGEVWTDEIDSKGDIEIGNDVWIGTQCIILSGAKIGNGAVIGANSLVINEIPPYAIAVGSPAKVISYRFPEEIIIKLQKIQWWNWSIEKIKNNYDFFDGELTLNKIENIV
jgi:virginiamycin A acetyltransferase